MKNIALLVIDVQKVYSLNYSRLKVNNVESVVENINKIMSLTLALTFPLKERRMKREKGIQTIDKSFLRVIIKW